MRTGSFRAGAPNVWWAFILIVLGFALSNAVSIYEMRSSQAQVRLITQHAATNIEVASKLSRDVDRERMLKNHILEKSIQDTDRTENEVFTIDADITTASRSYDPTGADATESAAWQQLSTELAILEPQVVRAIALSRQNEDEQAQARFETIDAQLGRIDQITNNLLELNYAAANQEAAEVRALQRRAVICSSRPHHRLGSFCTRDCEAGHSPYSKP